MTPTTALRQVRRGVVACLAAALVLPCGALPPSVAVTAAASSPPPWTCGFSNHTAWENPVEQLRGGTLVIRADTYDITDQIDWKQSASPSMRMLLQALKWLEPLITSRQPADLAQARDLVRRWAVDHAGPVPADLMAWNDHAAAMRTTTLTCLLLAQPERDTELEELIRRHIAWLSDPRNHRPTGNHGLVSDTALIGAACALGDGAGVALGQVRTAKALDTVLLQDGAPNEQAPGYTDYVRHVLLATRRALDACSAAAPLTRFSALDALPLFMAHATRPDGGAAMIGNTADRPIPLWGSPKGTPLEYAMSKGTSGTRPDQRVGIYPKAGYVFARSGWGATRPLVEEDYWTLRFGPGRILHGHADHTSITMFGRGRQLIVDPGFTGYARDEWSTHLGSPAAHSVTVVQGLEHRDRWGTKLVGQRVRSTDETFAVRGSPYPGITRTRTVLAAHDRPVTVVVDRSASTRTRTFHQLWHVHPDFRVVRVTPSGVHLRSGDGVDDLRVISLAWPGGSPAGVSVTRGRTKPLQGWYVAKEPVPAPVVGFRSRTRTQLQVALIIPTAPGASVAWSLNRLTDRTARLRVSVDGRTLTADIDRDSGWITRR